ncbi:MAG TPA: proton-conducting transporter membrane subunit [Gemmatimonadales bacterium]|nr:proton-conducting transporter membrane subunit [Gemmatimonadales bacterium]
MSPFFLGLALILGGGLAAARSGTLFRLLVAGGCLVGSLPAFAVLAGGAPRRAIVPVHVPGGPWLVGIDGLSAWFLLIVFGAGVAAALYGVSYLGRGHDPARAPRSHLLLSFLLVSLALVVTAAAAIPFLMAWELMAIWAYFLLMYESEKPDVRRAGLLYLIVTHTATLALFALFALWGVHSRDLTFDALRAAGPSLPGQGVAVLSLALFAFGLKAGVVPLHFWLPEAHAAAPSHVSAVFSGVMIKTGIYGLLRVLLLLGGAPAWWGWTVLSLGVISGVLGVLWALTQHDLKRLLAYHSVENIGIILLGIGAGTLGMAYRHPGVALLGFAGAALHTLNHALFKCLLFLGAGAVVHATGTRDIERLGGLARRMPLTWAAFLAGSVAIVGLPPLNGFVSEWVTYQALLAGGALEGPIRLQTLAVAGLGIVGALALACFAKVCGIVFLGRPRTPEAWSAGEVERGMLLPLVLLVLACVFIGLVPAVAVGASVRVASAVAGLGATDAGATARHLAAAARAVGWTSAALVLLVALLGVERARRRARRRPRQPTWGCGFAGGEPRMQYTASSFAAPLIAAYQPIAGVRVERSASAFRSHPTDLVLDGGVRPLWHGLRWAAERLRPIQQGHLHLYLLYLVATVILLLLLLSYAGGGR